MSSGLANVNPQTWVSFDLTDKNKMRIFLKQLADWATWMQSGGAAAGINSLSGVLFGSSLYVLLDDLGTLSTSPTISCTNYSRIVISGNLNATARGITLTGLANGTEVSVYMRNGGTHNFKITATDPSSSAYSILAYWAGTGANSRVDMTATGWTGTNAGFDYFFVGTTCKVGGSNFLPLLALEG